MRTCATLFAGGGLSEIGLKRAGYAPLWAVEHDPAITAVYATNHGDHIITADVRSVDYAALPRVDLLWLSPPCPSFSVAKTNRGETATDLEIADACARAIESLQPRAVIVENVRGYAGSHSFARIRAALDSLDYWSHSQVVNAADYGTPQTRERLILRAVSGGWMQAQRPWPAPVKWRGWYEAIEDLIPGLPDSAFAPWQLARLPAELRESIIIEGHTGANGTHLNIRRATEPMHTVSAGTGTTRAARAWLVEGNTPTTRAPIVAGVDDPMWTVRAAANKGMPRALVPPGRVVSLSPRCLARFQGVPDSYQLPEKKSLACRVIGNGVAVEVAYEAARSLS